MNIGDMVIIWLMYQPTEYKIQTASHFAEETCCLQTTGDVLQIEVGSLSHHEQTAPEFV